MRKILKNFASNFLNTYQEEYKKWGLTLNISQSRNYPWAYINVYSDTKNGMPLYYGCYKITVNNKSEPYIYSSKGYFLYTLGGERIDLRLGFLLYLIKHKITKQEFKKYIVSADYFRADIYCRTLYLRDHNIFMIKTYDKESMIYKWESKKIKRKAPKLRDLSYTVERLVYECLENTKGGIK